MKLPITAIVMTHNEERNLEACLASVSPFVAQIVVVDSYSSDRTLEIARCYTDHVFQNAWVNYATQYRWASSLPVIDQTWLLRLDADERWSPEGFSELSQIMSSGVVDGVYVRMKIFFMGRWIRHGGFYPNFFLRVYKRDKGKMEDRWMDEHVEVNGTTIVSQIDVIEANYDRQSNLVLFTQKHNGYSTREAVDMLALRHSTRRTSSIASLSRTKTERKRWLKENVYARTPLFVRPAAYFLYRYFFRLGILDGPEGLVFHTLQGFWYRFLVDAKIWQIEQLARREKKTVAQILQEHFGVTL